MGCSELSSRESFCRARGRDCRGRCISPYMLSGKLHLEPICQSQVSSLGRDLNIDTVALQSPGTAQDGKPSCIDIYKKIYQGAVPSWTPSRYLSRKDRKAGPCNHKRL